MVAAALTGRAGEDHVAEVLLRHGWHVLDRNYRAAGGEIDLVVGKPGRIRFIEVKARSRGDGLAAVGATKRRRLRQAAEAWMHVRPAALDHYVGEAGDIAFAIAELHLERGRVRLTWWDDPF